MRYFAALAILALPALAADEPAEIPLRCNPSACVIPRQVLLELLEAHNFHVQTIRDMEAQGCKVRETETRPPLKKERDS